MLNTSNDKEVYILLWKQLSTRQELGYGYGYNSPGEC